MTERWTGENVPLAVRSFIAGARVGRLATANGRNEPRVVPICFAWLDTSPPVIVSVLDEKPKQVTDGELARVRNLRRNTACSLVIDRYDEDWTHLLFAQINGAGRVIGPDDPLHDQALAALQDKYVQYRAMDLAVRLVILLEIESVTTWRGDGGSFRS